MMHARLISRGHNLVEALVLPAADLRDLPYAVSFQARIYWLDMVLLDYDPVIGVFQEFMVTDINECERVAADAPAQKANL